MSDSHLPENKADLQLTVDLVCAYLSNNHLQAQSLPELIASVHGAMAGLASPAASAEPASEKATPAQVKKSISNDALISFIDGKPYKTLKRHLTGHGLNPETYRAQYGLPADYPMTAPGYSARRSELAHSLGLGRKPSAPAAIAPPKKATRRRPAQAAK